MMKCPKCETDSLRPIQYRGVEVDRCRRCQGIWFDQDELPEFLNLSRKELRSIQSEKTDPQANMKRGDCPRDGKEMLRVYSPRNQEVTIDHCVECGGIWLDSGELAKLIGR